MKIFFALLIIVFLAFSGYHLTFRGVRLPLFARTFYLTGTEFLFLGLLLGPQFLNLLDPETTKGLEPLGTLLLGWIGLLFGFQFEMVKLRRFPIEFFFAAIVEGLLTLTLVFLGVYFALFSFISISGPMKIVAALVLAAAAACTAQTGLAILAPEIVDHPRNTVTLLRYISSIDGLSALMVFGLIFLFRPLLFTEASWTGEMKWGASVGLGTFASLFLYNLFLTQRRTESELILLVIGMAVLISGMASVLNFSPLLANFVVGFCLVNLSREKERIFEMLIRVEKPFYLLLLVFLGVNWRLDTIWIFLSAAGYCLFRCLGKFSSGFLVTRLSPGLGQYPSNLGFGLLDPGGLPLAILLDFQNGFPSDMTNRVISVVLLAVILNNFLSLPFLHRLLKAKK
jgi:hypothetical protein